MQILAAYYYDIYSLDFKIIYKPRTQIIIENKKNDQIDFDN